MSSLPQPLMNPRPVLASAASSSTQGSFGPVFIMLAVITVLAAIACFIGRLCTRRFSQEKPWPNRTLARGDRDYGFETSIPKAKPTGGRYKGEAKSHDIEFGFKTSNPETKPECKQDAKAEAHPASSGAFKGMDAVKNTGVGGKMGECTPGANGNAKTSIY